MKEGKCKRHRIICVITALILLLSAASAWAETVTLPMTMEITPLSLDFEITESIKMTASDSNTLTVDSLNITSSANNILGIMISDINVVQHGDWILVPDTTDFSGEVDSKKFSLVTSQHDFSTGSYSNKTILDPGESTMIEFSGHVGVFTEAVSEKAAEMIVTVEYAPQEFTFKINLVRAGGVVTEFTAMEGMTWGEWIESEYNTIGFQLCQYGGCHVLHPDNYVVFDGEGNYWCRKDALIVENYRYLLTDNYETGA